MAYVYLPNNYHNLDNYQHNQSYIDYSSCDYFTEPRYVDYYDSKFYTSSYQHDPTPSLIGYYSAHNYNQNEFLANKNSNIQNPISTQFVISHSNTNEANDLDFEEYNPEPFHGGYDISETYGKSLPPSEEICYPPSKFDPNNPSLEIPSYDSVPSPYGKNESIISNKAMEEKEASNSQKGKDDADDDDDDDDNDDDDDDDDDEEEGKASNNVINEEDYYGKGIIIRQMPYGYGMEAMDICEGVFGGYFPCLWKRNIQGSKNVIDHDHQSDDGGDYDYWKGTADYLFGNPNPYGGTMPEKGSYGDPVLMSYQRHYGQQPLCEQVDYGGNKFSIDNNYINF